MSALCFECLQFFLECLDSKQDVLLLISQVLRGNPRVKRQAPTKTALLARRLTIGVQNVTVTAAAVLQLAPEPPPPAQPPWPGHYGLATNLQVWPSASKKKRRTRGARLFLTAMSSQRICRIRRSLIIFY